MRIAVVGTGRSHAGERAAVVAARGHEVCLFTVGPVRPVPELIVRTRPIPRGPLEAISTAAAFLREIRSFGPDILHLHYAGGKLGTLATLAGVRPFVVSVMGSDVHPKDHPGGLPFLERRATRRILEEADLILAKSNGLRSAIAALGDFQARIETVVWGVDPAPFRRDRAAAEAKRAGLGLAPEDQVILSPRQMRPLYNIRLIVEAMPKVLERVPRALLLLTEFNAEAEYRRSVEAVAARLRLADRVRFLGELPHAEMPALYSLAEVVVSVPSNDGLPQSLFEAMACEAPLVLARLPSYEEVVGDGLTALLADRTPDAVAEAVLRVLTEPALAADLAAAALARVREVAFLPGEVAKVESLYREVVAQARGRRRRGPRHLLDAATLLLR